MQHFKNKKIGVHIKIIAGFTVIEALVAISILLLAVSGAFASAQSSLQSSNFVKNRVTAYYLAQEGIEYIRHLRDNNGLSIKRGDSPAPKWLGGVISLTEQPCSTACYVDTTKQSCTNNVCATPCPSGNCPNLNLNKDGQFQYDPVDIDNVGSSFKRVIKVEVVTHPTDTNSNDPQTEVKVTSTVSWVQAGITKSLSVSENLYNWQQL